MSNAQDWVLAKVEVLGWVNKYQRFLGELKKVFTLVELVDLRNINWDDVDTTSYDILQQRKEIKRRLDQMPDGVGFYIINIWITSQEMKYFGTVLNNLNQTLQNYNLCFCITKYQIGGYRYSPYAAELYKWDKYLEYLKTELDRWDEYLKIDRKLLEKEYEGPPAQGFQG